MDGMGSIVFERVDRSIAASLLRILIETGMNVERRLYAATYRLKEIVRERGGGRGRERESKGERGGEKNEVGSSGWSSLRNFLISSPFLSSLLALSQIPHIQKHKRSQHGRLTK
jgi:hypothetical protein